MDIGIRDLVAVAGQRPVELRVGRLIGCGDQDGGRATFLNACPAPLDQVTGHKADVAKPEIA